MLMAIGAAVVGLIVAAGLTVAGINTLADSTAGQEADGPSEVAASQRLPYTATALVGVADEDGWLTSVVVMALEPDGTGGAIVGIAATADRESGNTGELRPIDAVLQVEGPDAFLTSIEGLTGLSFDVVEVIDQRRFAQLVTPLGELSVRFPIALRDASTGEQWPVGNVVVGAAGGARAITAADPSIEDWFLEPGRAAIWDAVADRVGAGIGSALPVESDQALPAPPNLDEFVDRLFAGPVAFRDLGYTTVTGDRLEDELAADLADAFGTVRVDAAVAHDRAEMLMVFGAVAPGRMGAPLDAPSFRIVAGYRDEDLSTLELNNADVLKQAIDKLLFVKVNIVSVADLPTAGVPDLTQIEVADPDVLEAVAEGYEPLFGEIDVSVAEVVIDGVDIVVTLGRSFLDEVEPVGVAISGDDVGSDSDDDSDDTSDEG